MRLSAMADSLRTRLESGDSRGLAPEEFFALLVEDEYAARRNRKLQRMIVNADFKPERPCIENLDYSSSRGISKAQVMQLTTPTWVQDARHVIITGPTGCGKTYLAEAIGLQACRMGFAARKVRYRILLEEIRAAKGTGTYLKYLQKLSRIRVLILDDFLMHTIDQTDGAHLMDVVEEKQQTGSLVITTQYPIGKWHHQLPEPTLADAVCDRLVHGAYTFNLKGESMRKKAPQSASK
jgi:DNA replication protein DnaC